MKKIKLILTLCLLGFLGATAQNSCPGLNQPTAPGDSCHASPYLCGSYWAQYCGSNTGLTDDSIGGELLQNAGFLRFFPCVDSVVFSVNVANCTPSGDGLSFGIFAGSCPDSGLLFSENVMPNISDTLIFNNLQAESIYTLVVSGINGNECEFNIEAIAGIGTAQPGPVNCTCTDGYILGPSTLCPGDIGTYTLVPPDCTFSGGQPVGGNGYYCNPSSSDTLKLVWQIPVETHFVGDSTGFTIQIMADSSLFELDSIAVVSLSATFEVVPTTPTVNFPADTLTFCTGLAGFGDCMGVIQPKEITIFHELDYEYCTLNCANTECYIAGESYTQPGNYIIDIDNCHRLIVQIDQDIVPPYPPIVPPQSICQGASATLTIINEQWPNIYFWSTGAIGPSITVAPLVTTTYNILATNTINGCISDFQTVVNVSLLTHDDFGEVGVISCSQPCVTFQGQVYCQPGPFFIQTGPCSSIAFSIGSDPAIPTVALPPVTICAGECFDFFGQMICADSLATHLENCTLFTQQIIVSPTQLNNLGVVGMLSCSVPCIDFQGVSYCSPGTFSTSNGQCGTEVFEILFVKETLELGEIGVITCAENCVLFEGAQYCQPGLYTTEDTCFIKHFSVGASFSQPGTTAPQLDCLPSNTQFTVGFTISGLPPFKVNSETIIGSNFLSDPLQNGTQFNFTVEQANGCQALVTGSFDCASMCTTNAGALSAETLHGCAGQSIMQVQSLTTATPSAGDVEEYWLQSANNTLISQNNTGTFAFVPGLMASEEIYFVRRVVGPPDVSGHPDMDHACTSASNAQPIVFHALPTGLDIGPDFQINIGQTINIVANTASVPASIQWSADNGDNQTGGLEWRLQPLENMLVHCEILDSNGCVATDEAAILVALQEGIYRPNVLLLEANQAENQHFTLYSAEGWIRNIVSLGIYDRWGAIVWQKQNFPANAPNLGWDGHKNGAVVNPDVYVYLAVVELANGDLLHLKGDLTVLR